MKVTQNYTPKVACIIPTYNDIDSLKRCLASLREQKNIDFKVIIVDSSSLDGTAEYASRYADIFVSIQSSDFNHGGTRQMIAELYDDFEILVFLTQDAYLDKPDSLLRIINPFTDNNVSAVCGRQLPHVNATVLSQHARYFNYPNETLVKAASDIRNLGLKTPFLSNSFSAYRRSTLISTGGFPSNVILSEDMYIGAKMILCGFKIVYAADATCYHSHNYSLLEEFKRYFDIGVFHAREDWIRKNFGGAGGEGLKYVKSEIKFLWPNNIHLIPESFLRNALKLIAYKLGQLENKLPNNLKRKLSMHKGFWL